MAPIKLLATVLTLAFGGSVGKEGPCAQIGAAITSLFADVLRLKDEDRRRLVICGIGAGFAAVFGTPVSGALFGIEVLYRGRIEYPVFFPCLIAGIVAHLVCGVNAPVPVLHEDLSILGKSSIVPMAVALGGIIGATSGAAVAHLIGLPSGVFAAFGFVSVLAAAANTPIAAAVMGMELLPTQLGVYAALCAGTAFLIVGHRSVYASQKLGFSKSAGLEPPLDVSMGEVRTAATRIRKGSLTELVHKQIARGPDTRKKPR